MSVTPPGSGAVTFSYDPFGRRIKKVSGGTTIYVYDGAGIVEEADATGGVVARYTQGPGIDEPLAMLRSAATSYYVADGLGSITSLTDASGAVAASYTYDSFGNLSASTGSIANPYRYTARELDPETSLYYYRARYYDPSSGRFLSQDPLQFGGSTPNFYEYVRNGPTNFSDPLGLQEPAPSLPPTSPPPGPTLVPQAPAPAPSPFAPIINILGRVAGIAGIILGSALELNRGEEEWLRQREECRRTLDRCLDACAAGGAVWDNFCRSLPDPKLRAECWQQQHASETACRNWCFWYFTP